MTLKDYTREIIGAYGILMILGGYFLNSFGYIGADNVWYQLMNLTGGMAFVYYTLVKHAWASLVVNVVWVMIAIVSLWKIFE